MIGFFRQRVLFLLKRQGKEKSHQFLGSFLKSFFGGGSVDLYLVPGCSFLQVFVWPYMLAGPNTDCARLFGGLWGVGRHLGFSEVMGHYQAGGGGQGPLFGTCKQGGSALGRLGDLTCASA